MVHCEVEFSNRLSFRFYRCWPRDELQYLVFDYLNHEKTLDVVDDENLAQKIEQFIKFYLFDVETIVVPERQILGPYKYTRAELISIAVQLPNDGNDTLADALRSFCTNQSSTSKSNIRQKEFGADVCPLAGVIFRDLMREENMLTHLRDIVFR